VECVGSYQISVNEDVNESQSTRFCAVRHRSQGHTQLRSLMPETQT
jgi:hypothetical protein